MGGMRAVPPTMTVQAEAEWRNHRRLVISSQVERGFYSCTGHVMLETTRISTDGTSCVDVVSSLEITTLIRSCPFRRWGSILLGYP